MDEPILDAICERLKQKTYIKGSRILRQGGLVENMIFVVRGKLESIGEDGTRVRLSEGDACGEELLTWYLEHSSVSTGISVHDAMTTTTTYNDILTPKNDTFCIWLTTYKFLVNNMYLVVNSIDYCCINYIIHIVTPKLMHD